MRLSSDDLPMFFAPHHAALAERLRAAASALEAVEQPGAHASETERDRAAAAALAAGHLLALVVPTEHARDGGPIDTRGVCPACAFEWRDTMCLRCHEWSRHDAWYTRDDDETPSGRPAEPR